MGRPKREKRPDGTRDRQPNYSAEEETELLRLVVARADVIECKKQDTISNAQRTDAWINIAREFNKTAPFHRDYDKLREKYGKIKASLKNQLTARGGQSPTDLKLSSDLMQLAYVLGHEEIDEDESSMSSAEQILPRASASNWSPDSPAMLEKPPRLKRPNGAIEKNASQNGDDESMRIKCAFLEDEHNVRMKILERELQIKDIEVKTKNADLKLKLLLIENAKEEHAIRMKILKTELADKLRDAS